MSRFLIAIILLTPLTVFAADAPMAPAPQGPRLTDKDIVIVPFAPGSTTPSATRVKAADVPKPGPLVANTVASLKDSEGQWSIRSMSALGVNQQVCMATYQRNSGPNSNMAQFDANGNVMKKDGSSGPPPDIDHPVMITFMRVRGTVADPAAGGDKKNPAQNKTQNTAQDKAFDKLRVKASTVETPNDLGKQFSIGGQTLTNLRGNITRSTEATINDIPAFVRELNTRSTISIKLGSKEYDMSSSLALQLVNKLGDCAAPAAGK